MQDRPAPTVCDVNQESGQVGNAVCGTAVGGIGGVPPPHVRKVLCKGSSFRCRSALVAGAA